MPKITLMTIPKDTAIKVARAILYQAVYTYGQYDLFENIREMLDRFDRGSLPRSKFMDELEIIHFKGPHILEETLTTVYNILDVSEDT